MLQMKNILLVLAAISSASALKVAEGGEGGLTVELMGKWKLWTDAHGKTYESHEKKMERLQVWLDNNGTYPIVIVLIVAVVLVDESMLAVLLGNDRETSQKDCWTLRRAR
jgi:hypothetical protein